MKNIFKKSIFVLLAAFVIIGCTKNFEEINTDPNTATVVPTAYLMTQGQRGFITGRQNITPSYYAQHWSQTQYTNVSRYETAELSFTGRYSGPLADIQQVINLNSDPETAAGVEASGSNNNQLAVARIMKVLIMQNATDTWGDLPYSEALIGSENFQPAYDSQSAIYAHFITELTEAAAQIDGGAGMEGDIIYGGDMAAWGMLANSLKVRIGMRMSEADAGAAQAAVVSGLNAGAFASNADDALYTYLTDAANDNPIFAHFLTRTDYAISNTLVDFMNNLNDPRVSIYGDDAPDFGYVVGMPYGLSQADAGSITNDAISFPGAAVRMATSPGIIMTYSELLFLRAEAAQRGWVADAPATVYADAITASLDFWGVDAADQAAYMAEPGIAFNGLQSIAEQKWISLYMNGSEAWSEWRRLDFPVLAPAPAAVEGRAIPRRRAYPNGEYDLNGTNVEAAVARQGADAFETTVWWDQ